MHFKGQLELFLVKLEERPPRMLQPLRTLKESVGRGSAQRNFVQALTGIFKFHQGVIPPTAGLFAEPELQAAYRNSLNRQGKGPHLLMTVVEGYIRSEQVLSRIDARVLYEFARQLIATVAPRRISCSQHQEGALMHRRPCRFQQSALTRAKVL